MALGPCLFWIFRFSKTKNTQLMTVSTETVHMAKSRPRKNQSDRSDLPCHIINVDNWIDITNKDKYKLINNSVGHPQGLLLNFLQIIQECGYVGFFLWRGHSASQQPHLCPELNASIVYLVLHIWQGYLKFSYSFIFDRIVCVLVTFYQWGHFVMLTMKNLNLICIQSWTYLNYHT